MEAPTGPMQAAVVRRLATNGANRKRWTLLRAGAGAGWEPREPAEPGSRAGRSAARPGPGVAGREPGAENSRGRGALLRSAAPVRALGAALAGV